jgi:hypothetical protein
MGKQLMTEQTSATGVEIVAPKGWTKVPTLLELKQDQTDARTIHDMRVAKINLWLDNLNVTGKAAVKPVPGQSSIQPKLIRKQAEWRYAALSEPFLSTDDVFKVKPVSWEDRDAAQQNELLLNHQLNTKIDKIRFIDEYVRTAVDEGTVIVQVGWEFYSETYDKEVPNMEFHVDPEMLPLMQQLDLMKQESPSLYATDVPDELKEAHDSFLQDGQPIRPVPIGGSRTVKKTRTVCNKPTLEVCDFRNLMIDPTAQGDLLKAGFIIKSYETSKSALKKSGKKYQNLDKINIASNSILATPDHVPKPVEQNFNFKDEPRKKFVAYQYWGKRVVDGTNIVTTFVAEWVGDVMIRMEEAPFPDRELPFISEHYLPVRKDNYGEPDGALLEDNQKVIGAVTRGMIDIMGKSANGQTGLRKDMLDATNKRKFDLGQDYEYNANVDPRAGVFMHTFPEIPASAQFMLNLQNMEAESMTGVKSWANGVSGSALGDVAAGVRGALDAASKRELGILRRLSSGMIKIGRKLISMNAEFLSEEEIVRVTNDKFVTVRRDDLPGNFDLRLSISTAEEDNNKAEQLAFMMQTSGPNMDTELAKMILSDIARLRKMPDLAQRIEAFQPEPDPVAQKQQQLVIAKLEAEIADIQAGTQKTLAEAGLSTAKISTEGAKQGNLKSKTDKHDLDFVEQESGVTQERALEKAGAVANGQAQLKGIDRQINTENKQHDLLKEYIKSNSA